jgi:hypothetical protein
VYSVTTLSATCPFHPLEPSSYISQIAGGIVGTLSIVIYGQLLRRPPLPIHRMASLAAFASAGGVLGGTVIRANAHADFFRTLDDRTSFIQALDNIQIRLGEKASSDSHPNSPYSAPEKEEMSREWEAGTPVGKSTDRHAASRTSSRLSSSLPFFSSVLMATPNCLAPAHPSSQLKSRWEEIRAEHARNLATRSSWDELRQNASRPKSDNAGNERIEVSVSQDPVAERFAEQQKFDALLEAERRKVAEGSPGTPWGT